MKMEIPVLDSGYVRLVDTWGTEESIIEAARMSTGKGFEGWEKDEKLLTYLYNHKHYTPFEMCGIVIEVKAPLFVFREWHRHRTQSYNEMSARYIPLPDENYLPSAADIAKRSGANANKQAAGSKECSEAEAQRWLDRVAHLYTEIQCIYERGLESGVPKELARIVVPVARYSRMRASANLRNWLQFLELRMAQGAQKEIREYAFAVANIVRDVFPRTMGLFLSKLP